MLNERLYGCRVCGLIQDSAPWGLDGRSPSFDICPCCGVEFGYEDATLVSILVFRQKWLEDGAPWWDSELKPGGWDLALQLESVPPEYL
ncbi:hypothetical protein D5H75_02395 [Bailinhaonella thermotolerans]|uniref:Uncharacterized protein n=1 Tax=Bailinhaonella thermotolerans TaxID=1070861 RepID=A0A3A4AZ51_9ACTN|nr:hypothetical protein D5H75_02395 [Bailinhaonella thermotolerans]